MRGFPHSHLVKNLPAMQETQVWFLGQEDPLEKEMAIHSSILAWKIPWTEESGGLQFLGLQRVRHNWATELNRKGKTRDLFKKIRDTKGTFHARMGTIKDRNDIDLTEAEDIKKRWQEECTFVWCVCVKSFLTQPQI